MKQIHIVHLYYDLLNLYGESGNIKAMKMQLENQGFNVSIHFKTLKDEIDFDKYDIIYISSGTEDSLELASKDIVKHKKEIKKAIDNNKFFLVTGNALNLFGKSKDSKYLEIFDYEVEKSDKRLIDEVFAECDFLESKVVGFQNQSTIIKNNQNPMFKLKRGINDVDGIHYNNFYGTTVLGPILVRNPEFLRFFLTQVVNQKFNENKKLKFDLNLDTKAYDEFIKNFYQNS